MADRAILIRETFTAEPGRGQVLWARRPRDHFSSDGFWRRSLREHAGHPAPFYPVSRRGHLQCRVQIRGARESFLAHHVVWVLAHGELPETDLDHIDGNPANNAIANLRVASRAQNARNALRRAPGLKGAYPAGGRWKSTVWDGRKARYLGTFDTAEEAHAAWVAANARLAGEFFNPGYDSVFG